MKAVDEPQKCFPTPGTEPLAEREMYSIALDCSVLASGVNLPPWYGARVQSQLYAVNHSWRTQMENAPHLQVFRKGHVIVRKLATRAMRQTNEEKTTES